MLSCHRSGDDNQSQDDSTNIYVRDSLVLQSEHPMLIDFRMFVHDLDSTDMNSAPLAVEHFHKFFRQRPGLYDSAFVVLQQLLDTIETNLNEKLYEDTTDYSPLMNDENVILEIRVVIVTIYSKAVSKCRLPKEYALY